MGRRPLSRADVGARIALTLIFALLLFGTLSVFVALDSGSHSASDTLRPFLITMVPVWLVFLWAVRIVLRSYSR